MNFSAAIALLLIAFIPYVLKAQKQVNVWYFGRNIGLDFNSIPPALLTNGALSTTEGSSSISDANGKLLFYTDGTLIWDRYHKRMPNGFLLKGHESSTQSAIIVPKPGSNNLYYVFTADAGAYSIPPNEGINYSIVDMCLNGGMGDVIKSTKNTQLLENATEKLCAVRHRNGKDIWIMAHEWLSNRFFAYLLTEKGLESNPVITSIGKVHKPAWPRPNHPDDNTIGYMKFSPQGTKLAVAIWDDASFELFDFDNSSGVVSNPLLLETCQPIKRAGYGIEFSPDGRLLYVNGATEPISLAICQYDLHAGSSEAIAQSAMVIKSGIIDADNPAEVPGAMQLGPDGKIYVKKGGFRNSPHNWIGIINSPNSRGLACQYVNKAIAVDNQYSTVGLPNFLTNYFDPTSDIVDVSACYGGEINFYVKGMLNIFSIDWDFGDNSKATGTNVLHSYHSKGPYTVTATVTTQDRKQFVVTLTSSQKTRQF